MSVKHPSRRTIGKATPTPPRVRKSAATPPVAAAATDAVVAQAKHDIDAGRVDTDLRNTAGLDAQRRAELVPGAGGKPPSEDA
jgi:hypothetical protein